MIFITLNYIHCFLMIFIHGCGMWVLHVPDLSFQKLATLIMCRHMVMESQLIT